MRPRVVLDTVVFVRSLLNPYSAAGRLVFDHADDYDLVLSAPVVREILEVLRRPEITRKIRFVAGMDTRRVLDILAQGEFVEPTDIPPASRDPNDDKFLATAVAGSAGLLVTADQDLLALGTYRGIEIVDTLTFLRLLEAELAP